MKVRNAKPITINAIRPRKKLLERTRSRSSVWGGRRRLFHSAICLCDGGAARLIAAHFRRQWGLLDWFRVGVADLPSFVAILRFVGLAQLMLFLGLAEVEAQILRCPGFLVRERACQRIIMLRLRREDERFAPAQRSRVADAMATEPEPATMWLRHSPGAVR